MKHTPLLVADVRAAENRLNQKSSWWEIKKGKR
jgi:hypothetical protein